MSHNTTLSTLAARTAISAIEKDNSSLKTSKDIYKTSGKIFKELYNAFPSVYKNEMKKSVIAFILSNVAKKAVKIGDITISERHGQSIKGKGNCTERRLYSDCI